MMYVPDLQKEAGWRIGSLTLFLCFSPQRCWWEALFAGQINKGVEFSRDAWDMKLSLAIILIKQLNIAYVYVMTVDLKWWFANHLIQIGTSDIFWFIFLIKRYKISNHSAVIKQNKERR